tara:strand:- start:1002 stop:1379 length:378 start_codon:yes stop_codon:yes gene_type:complete
LFAFFLVFSVDFATQNTLNVNINYKIEWINFNFFTERPIFVPIFFSFAFGIIFSVLYFFISHAALLRKLLLKNKEIKKLESLLENEKSKQNSIVDHKNGMQHNHIDNYDDAEPELNDIESDNFKK